MSKKLQKVRTKPRLTTSDRDLYERIAGCEGKVRYKTKEEAEHKAGRMKVYYCSFCTQYHRSDPLRDLVREARRYGRAFGLKGKASYVKELKKI